MYTTHIVCLQYRESQGLVPVTVKQLSELSQSGDDKSSTFLIASVEVTNVRKSSTLHYKLDLLLILLLYIYIVFICAAMIM